MLECKRVIAISQGQGVICADKGTIKKGQSFLCCFTYWQILKYHSIIKMSRNCVPNSKLKDETWKKKSWWLQIRLQTHWIALHVNGNNVTLIALELNKFQNKLKSL